MNEIFEMTAKTFQGLEGVLADELTALGAQEVTQGKRVVAFKGDKALLYKANFCCRTALRILKPFYKFKATDADELYEKVKLFEWDTILKINKTFSIDATVYSEDFRHSRFVTYRVKDAIADFFTAKYDKRPSIRINNPDIQLNVHISGDEVTISLDSSGESLHRRGYRVAQTDAPINEVLAAGILKLAGWDGQCDFVDPMCGSGTFLIEAALMAANINPGVFRKEFAFEHWDDFDADLFSEIFEDDSNEREFTHKIYGSDIAPKAIAASEANIKGARVGKYITLSNTSIQNITDMPENGLLVTNPPYGERISVEDMEGLYTSIGEKFKKVFKGYHAWVIGYRKEYFDCIGLKPSVKLPVLNGDLECELREYVIFSGKYSEMRREGGSIRNEKLADHKGKRLGRIKFEETYRDGKTPRKDDKRPRRDFSFGDGPRGEKPARKASEHKTERKRSDWREEKRRVRTDYAPGINNEKPQREAKRELSHEEEFARKMKFAQQHAPTLGADAEVPIVHGRRNSWKRNTKKSEE